MQTTIDKIKIQVTINKDIRLANINETLLNTQCVNYASLMKNNLKIILEHFILFTVTVFYLHYYFSRN